MLSSPELFASLPVSPPATSLLLGNVNVLFCQSQKQTLFALKPCIAEGGETSSDSPEVFAKNTYSPPAITSESLVGVAWESAF